MRCWIGMGRCRRAWTGQASRKKRNNPSDQVIRWSQVIEQTLYWAKIDDEIAGFGEIVVRMKFTLQFFRRAKTLSGFRLAPFKG